LGTLSGDSAFESIGLLHKDLDVCDPASCRKLAELKPAAVINTAAFHKTDSCEDDPAKAFNVNAVGAYNVSRVCAEIGATHVFISTDYVFSGSKGAPYDEEDTPSPVNVYGTSKLAGERLTATYSQRHYIVRSSSLYGRAGASGKGGNFIETILKKASAGEEITVVDDVVMSPTSTRDLARVVCSMLRRGLPFGVYHVANSGSCSWWEFAKQIVTDAGLETEVKRTNSSEYPRKAKRPQVSALATVRLAEFGISVPSWQDALADYIAKRGFVRP
jgi:dTDP-4-dehydrorhamnose reductase